VISHAGNNHHKDKTWNSNTSLRSLWVRNTDNALALVRILQGAKRNSMRSDNTGNTPMRRTTNLPISSCPFQIRRTMMELSLWLYGKPNWDLDLEEKTYIKPETLEEHGHFMKHHLERTAHILNQLQQAGWTILPTRGSIYALTLQKDTTRESAEQELSLLGVPPEEVQLAEAIPNL